MSGRGALLSAARTAEARDVAVRGQLHHSVIFCYGLTLQSRCHNTDWISGGFFSGVKSFWIQEVALSGNSKLYHTWMIQYLGAGYFHRKICPRVWANQLEKREKGNKISQPLTHSVMENRFRPVIDGAIQGML